MIIVNVMGGLGNQLFQYAMGRSLSLRSGSPFKIDLSFFENYEWHAYSLNPFQIKTSVATKKECDEVKNQHNSLINKILRKTIGKGEVVIHEKDMLFHREYLQITSPAYLSGYWQCEKYFEQYSDIIRDDLQITIPPSSANATLLKQIHNSNAVSLHIRRGNFVNVEEVNKVHGTCSIDYYHASMDYFNKQLSFPVYYVFSDDINWAKENLKGGDQCVFVNVNDAAHDYEDLRLMQNCKHHILANSTFSWWGAWLNPRTDKTVIAPLQWYADPQKNKTAADIIPERWIRM